ncbi:hypothetical protein Tco_1046077, partial [Tanacetum coccineum]
MSMMRELTYFLGFQIKQDFKGISICQEKYVKDLLKKYDLVDCASVKCPMLPPNNLGPDETGIFVNETLYQANPKESHLIVVKRIFRYLKGTLNLGLWYLKGLGFDLKAYSDSDYAGCNLDRKSTSGGCQILGGKLICWSAKKQSFVAMSLAEAEYVTICCDNTSAIAISNNPVLHSRTKHIDIRYHFIRDHILKDDIELHFIPTDLQLADIFTKPLAEPSFTRLVAELGNLNVTSKLKDKHSQYLIQDSLKRALTLQPSAMYVEYLKEFWYTAEVEEETKIITFLLSWWDKPMSFTQDKFISAIGLPIYRDVVPLHPKETVRVILLKKQVVETHVKVTVAIDVATKSLEASELAEEQGNQLSTTEAKKSLVASKLAEEQGNQLSAAEAEKVLDQNVEEEKDDEFVAMEEVAEEQSLEFPTV